MKNTIRDTRPLKALEAAKAAKAGVGWGDDTDSDRNSQPIERFRRYGEE